MMILFFCRRNSSRSSPRHGYNRCYLHGEVIKFCMPTLSPTMINGKLLKLLVPTGGKVNSYQHFINVSTKSLTKISDGNNDDKELEIEIMEDEYYVAKYIGNIDDVVAINEPIALLCENKNDISEVNEMSIESIQKLRIAQWQGYLKS